jgi:adenylosuccinate lyase
MPHKRNPVSSEQICGLARVVRANAGAAFENIALWHERDISHSSVERVILPDSTILADYLLARMTDIVSGMRVFPERMRRNLDLTGGLVFSGQLLQDLVEAGAAREDAYKWVQEHAMAAWETETNSGGLPFGTQGKQVEPAPDFRQRVASDPRITKVLDSAALERTFDLNRQLRHVDAIFARVFP